MTTLQINGYEQEGYCAHCGRTLKHCIVLNDGSIVGATCFDKKLTKPRVYQGKTYRVGSESIITLAKAMQFWGEERRRMAGFFPERFIFEAA